MTEQVRQAVMIAADLHEQCKLLIPRILRAGGGDLDQQDESVMRAELERCYGGIWEQLDAAARHTRAAGRDTARYDALRAKPGIDHRQLFRGSASRVTGDDGKHYTVETRADVDREAFDAARDAVAALKGAWPELDFTPAPAPDVDLRPRGFFARLFGKR